MMLQSHSLPQVLLAADGPARTKSEITNMAAAGADRDDHVAACRPFFVLLGPDYAGKSTAMTELANSSWPWRFISVDDSFLSPGHALISRLRRHVVKDALPVLGKEYSFDFAVSLLQTAVVHLRDQIVADDDRRPALVDSYYYKILAKCRLIGSGENPMLTWWRSFPQPRRVLYLDVAPQTAWGRSRAGVLANRLEHYGEYPGWEAFQAFQADLRKMMLDEVRHLPVSIIHERDGIAGTAQDIREVLSGERS
jgi:thymidylate kinase